MLKPCKILDINRLQAMKITAEPFPYAVVSNSIFSDQLALVQKDYPPIEEAGSFPLSAVNSGPLFNQLIDELSSDAFRDLIAEKFEIDLTDKPVMITVRGKADHTDGRIHTDSKSKLITVLLYMNEAWQPDGGRLRLLHNNHDLDNYFEEVSPEAGTLLVFKVTQHGWHGHKPFIGTRKVIQLNWVTTEKARNKHAIRHKISAKMKAIKRALFGGPKPHACPDC
jgi:SM-20-related protein